MIRPVSPKVSSWGKIHGGKFRYCRDYLRLFDAAGCDFYAESYYGGGGVHMNIPNGIFKREYINDIGHIHRTLSALKNPRHSDAVVHLLRTRSIPGRASTTPSLSSATATPPSTPPRTSCGTA